MKTQEKILARLAAEPEEGMKPQCGFYTGLMCTVCRILGSGASPQDVEDCVSAAFARFWFSRRSYDPQRCGLSGWLCIIAKRQCMICCEKRRPAGGLEGASRTRRQAPRTRPRRERRQELLSAIDALENTDREILLRKYFMSQNSKDIARIMHMTVSAVDTRAHRAVKN